MPMTISIDDELKQEFTEVCKEMGMSPSTAITIFAKTVVREKAIPFQIRAISQDLRRIAPTSESIEGIKRGFRDFEEGHVISREEAESCYWHLHGQD